MCLFQKHWRQAAVGIDGNTTLFGVNIFDYSWECTGKTVTIDGVSCAVPVYRVTVRHIPRTFAAIEMSYCVWSFWL